MAGLQTPTTAAAVAETSGTFECNICLDQASDPVVTHCGHLYCWPCVYRWMRLNESPVCPICKSDISQEKMVPIYGRGGPQVDPRCAARFFAAVPAPPAPARSADARLRSARRSRELPEAEEIPERPHSQSPRHRRHSGRTRDQDSPVNGGGGANGRRTPNFMSSSLGFVPSLFGLQAGADGTVQMQLLGELSPEQAQQAFLSRALLLLGSFVILCLLLFSRFLCRLLL